MKLINRFLRRRADHRAEPVEHSDLSPEPVALRRAWWEGRK